MRVSTAGSEDPDPPSTWWLSRRGDPDSGHLSQVWQFTSRLTETRGGGSELKSSREELVGDRDGALPERSWRPSGTPISWTKCWRNPLCGALASEQLQLLVGIARKMSASGPTGPVSVAVTHASKRLQGLRLVNTRTSRWRRQRMVGDDSPQPVGAVLQHRAVAGKCKVPTVYEGSFRSERIGPRSSEPHQR